MPAKEIGELSIKLADAALIARGKGDEVHAIFFAIMAAETLALAKALGWKLEVGEIDTEADTASVSSKQDQQVKR